MYDRAQRQLSIRLGCTTDNVGPGTYDVNALSPTKIRADGYAPFLSMTGRESVLNPSDQVIAAPGPGHYDPGLPQNLILGGKTMSNKGKRFQESLKDTPGPGAYNLSKRADWIKETGRSISAPGKVNDPRSSPSMMTSRVRFHRQPAAPSIPMPGQAYGYEENDDGTLQKQEAPNQDESLGPAYYNVDHNLTKTTKVYKGIHFGKLSSKRTDFGAKDGPGPGEYEPYQEPQFQVEHANLQREEQKKFEAKIPRYHELVVSHEEKKAVPGPGKYEIKGQFESHPPKVNTEGIEVQHPPFGSQSKRFHAVKGNNPAPGTYNDPRHALDGLKRTTGLKRSPFGQTSVRFDGDHHIKKTPGPGSYNAIGMGSDSVRKAYIESTRRGAFGTTAPRAQSLTSPDKAHGPGPAHYQVRENPFEPRYQQLSSAFASLSNRLAEPLPTVKELPPPGSYEVQRAYESSQGKLIRRAPRSDMAKQKQGAFQSSAARFAPPRDILIVSCDEASPGPGAYELKPTLNKKGGLMITKDQRFRDVVLENPGPGTYEFSPLVQDTVLKGTFNATLNNPLAPPLEGITESRSGPKHQFLLGV